MENHPNTSAPPSEPSTTTSTSLPPAPPVRGRPRSTSISSGSPNPTPGMPLPTLLPEPIPPSPQSTHTSTLGNNNNPFPFSFPSNSTSANASTTPNGGSSWGQRTGNGSSSGGGGWGHRPSLSVPGILSPSPLHPGTAPRGGRHRRTQSVSPPGFPIVDNGKEEEGGGELRRRSEPNVPVSKESTTPSLAIPISQSTTPRLNISTSIGTRLGGIGGAQKSPSSPTRSPRSRSISATHSNGTDSLMSTSPTGSSHFLQHHPQLVHHSQHSHHPVHIPHVSSHAALLQGIRSHALPHSPTLDPSSSDYHHDVSPLSTSPSTPHGFSSRRLSGGQHSSSRPLFINSASPSSSTSSPSTSSTSPVAASPPFGPTSPLLSPHHPSPLSLEVNRSGSPDYGTDDPSRHSALDEAMSDVILERQYDSSAPSTGGFPYGRRRSSGSFSPPLLPLPFDCASPMSPIISYAGGGRSRSGSITRAVSSSASPASLYLEEEQPSGSPNGALMNSPGSTVTCSQIDIARPPSPPLFSDSLFPVSGTLPPPSSSPPFPAYTPPTTKTASPTTTRSSALGFDLPSPIESSPPRQSPSSPSTTSSRIPLAGASPPSPSTGPPLSPLPSNLSVSRPSPPSSSSSPSLAEDPTTTSTSTNDFFPPPASPRRTPISLPPPLNAPTSIPSHLVVGGDSARRSRSRSKSRDREKSRSRSRSSSGERDGTTQGEGAIIGVGGGGGRIRSSSADKETSTIPRDRSPLGSGMRLSGLEFVPKVHSPLASPPATTDSGYRDTEKADESNGMEETEESARGGESTMNESDIASNQQELPPPIPPPSTDPSVSSSLGLPHLSIPATSSSTSPIGTPEHLEESLSPSSPHHSYFSLAPGAALARSPPTLGSPSRVLSAEPPPALERASSWEDELDDDDFDDLDPDGTGEINFSGRNRRASSGTKSEKERVGILEALDITTTEEEREKEREFAEREAERRRLEWEEEDRIRQERAREAEQERRKEFGALGFMEVDLATQGEEQLEHERTTDVGEAGDLSVGDANIDVLEIEEESLSALERIFVCAKSEAVEERVRVAHFLADWLPAVEICEAVEYVLPLLAGLIEDEVVKEIFAPQLDRVMWHFFSRCPLVELDPSSDQDSSFSGSPVPSRYKGRSNSLIDPSPASSNFVASDRSDTPPPTSETSPSQSNADRSNPDTPRISVTTFTSLLGALLTDQSTTVAKCTESALVRFLCRLKNKPIPPDASSDFDTFEFASSGDVPQLAVSEPDPHSSYVFTTEARQILEDEVVSGIVIGLARLDDEEQDASKSTLEGVNSKIVARPEKEESNEDLTDPILSMSPEEQSLEEGAEEDMQWMSRWDVNQEQNGDTTSAGPTMDTWGAPLVSFFDSDADGDRTSDSNDVSAQSIPTSRSPPDQVFSSFSPDQPADEESSIGKMVSMSLIGAIASADCLEQTVLVEQFLPEVERMKAEGMFYVRKEAVQALGNLASVVPAAVLESSILPLHDHFSKDQLWHVRRAAILALPAVCKPLPRAALRVKAVEAVEHFGADANRNVRSGALEIAGELIYLFHEDPDGVPDKLLSFFLGEPLEAPSAEGTTSRKYSEAHLSFNSALDSPPSTFFDKPDWDARSPSNNDADRQILTAFNFPAVVLTLGPDRWHLVRDHHRELCKDPVEKARQSLASSLHEVAKIIGPEQADASLLEPLSWFLRDVENIQAAILENLPSLLSSFSHNAAKTALGTLSDAWCEIGTWRLREHLLKKLAEIGPTFMQNGSEDEFLLLLVNAFKDPVASVREQAAITVPPLLNAVLDLDEPRSMLFAYLTVFRNDHMYRYRAAYVSTIVACVRASVPRDVFEAYFLEPLVALARDKVISVRIAVTRAISEACTCPALYADPSTRTTIRELLSILASSPDRDVRLPVLEFYDPTPTTSREPSPPSRPSSPPLSSQQQQLSPLQPPSSSSPTNTTKSPTSPWTSSSTNPTSPLPMPTRPNPFSYGIDDDGDSMKRQDSVDREDEEEDFVMEDESNDHGTTTTTNDDDSMEMDDDDDDESKSTGNNNSFETEGEGEGILLERSPSPSGRGGEEGQEVWTRDDGEFVEVSTR